jgi:uncharacterized protein (UPF0305 family)
VKEFENFTKFCSPRQKFASHIKVKKRHKQINLMMNAVFLDVACVRLVTTDVSEEFESEEQFLNTLKMEVSRYSETSVLTRPTVRTISQKTTLFIVTAVKSFKRQS